MLEPKLISLLILLTLSSACSDRTAAPPASEAVPSPPTQSIDSDANAVRAKLNAGGIPSDYAAQFENDQLVRITEHRHATDSRSYSGEYVFNGARLIGYRGAKLGDATELDLQFDMRGALQSGQGPTVTNEELSALQGRAQLLRSHALAQRATRMH